MKNIFIFTLSIIILLSCEKGTEGEKRTIAPIDISDATDIFVKSEFRHGDSSEEGTVSLYKRTKSGEVKEIPLLSTNGDIVEVEHLGIATFNPDKILLWLYFSSGNEDLYVVDRRNNDTRKIDSDFGALGYLMNLTNNNINGYTDSYSDASGNLYYLEATNTGSQFCMVDNKNYTKEILYNDKELGTGLAVDYYGNSVIQVYENTWVYRSKEGESLTFQASENSSVSLHGGIFALSGLDGFYYIVKNQGSDKYNLTKLSYDQNSKKMESESISNEIEISDYDDFYGVHYYNGTHLLIGSTGVLSIDTEMEIKFHRLYGNSLYGNRYMINSSIYYNDYKYSFNLETLKIEEIYTSALVSDYRVDKVGCKADGSIIFYGLNKINGEQVVAVIKNNTIVSEVSANETNTMKCVISWITL